MPIRIDNVSPAAAVSLISTSVTGSSPDGWHLAALETSDGAPIDLGAGPHALAPGQFVNARVRACAMATAESALRVMHSGMDYGAPGSPTGDVDPGSPLVIRLLLHPAACREGRPVRVRGTYWIPSSVLRLFWSSSSLGLRATCGGTLSR